MPLQRWRTNLAAVVQLTCNLIWDTFATTDSVVLLPLDLTIFITLSLPKAFPKMMFSLLSCLHLSSRCKQSVFRSQFVTDRLSLTTLCNLSKCQFRIGGLFITLASESLGLIFLCLMCMCWGPVNTLVDCHCLLERVCGEIFSHFFDHWA